MGMSQMHIKMNPAVTVVEFWIMQVQGNNNDGHGKIAGISWLLSRGVRQLDWTLGRCISLIDLVA